MLIDIKIIGGWMLNQKSLNQLRIQRRCLKMTQISSTSWLVNTKRFIKISLSNNKNMTKNMRCFHTWISRLRTHKKLSYNHTLIMKLIRINQFKIQIIRFPIVICDSKDSKLIIIITMSSIEAIQNYIEDKRKKISRNGQSRRKSTNIYI